MIFTIYCYINMTGGRHYWRLVPFRELHKNCWDWAVLNTQYISHRKKVFSTPSTRWRLWNLLWLLSPLVSCKKIHLSLCNHLLSCILNIASPLLRHATGRHSTRARRLRTPPVHDAIASCEDIRNDGTARQNGMTQQGQNANSDETSQWIVPPV